MNIILLHGKSTNPTEKWYPYFVDIMKKKGIACVAPALPSPKDPVLSEWVAELEKTNPNKESILIGHSRGGVAVLRYLENLETDKKVKKVILVATNAGAKKDIAIPTETNYGFYTEEGYDFEKIKSHCDDFIVIHSKDDPWVPFSAGVENAEGFNAKFLVFENKEHFGRNLDGEFPELVEVVLGK